MLNLKLFGAPQVWVNGDLLTLRRNSIKARAILYYLAATGTLQPRDRLAGLFWSDWPEAKARAYLRGELHLLSDLKDDYLIDTDGRLGLASSRCTVDLRQLQQVAQAAAPTVDELYAASRLYTGPLLDGIDSLLEESSPLFMDWLQAQREQVERQAHQLFYRFAVACADEVRLLSAGIDACNTLLDREPEREEIHRLKMQLLALDGQRAAALKQYDVCASALMDELGVPISAETNALYDRVLAGEFDRRSAVEGVRAQHTPFQAIAPPAYLCGRSAELEQLTQWLVRPGRGAVAAIVGMGGVGKTALAAALADQLRVLFSDGVLWGRVATDAPMDILQSWALAYDRDLSKITSLEARAAAMRNILSDKRVLIVLDDVVAGKPIELLLPGTATCAVLCTTRDRAEVALHASEILDLGELSLQSGVDLLAHLLGPAATAAEEGAAQELCHLLDGLPLAVEMAAQRILASPRRDLGRMVRSLRTASARLAHGISNRSVRTSFAVSWEGLGDSLKQTFALVGLFDGRSFSAEAIAALSQLEEDEVLDQLELLTTLSMLKFAGGDRFVQHRLLADFALEKLAEFPDPWQSQRRYLGYYQELAQRAAGDFAQLELEWEQLFHAVELAQQLQAWPELLGLVDAAAAPWFARARFDQARQGFLAGLAAAQQLEDPQRCTRYAFFLGRIALRQDDYVGAQTLLHRAIAGFSQNDNRARMAEALVDLADVEIELGAYAAAGVHLQQAEESYRSLAQPIGLAAVRCRQASIAYDQGALAEAAVLCDSGLSLLPAGGGDLVRSRILRLLADVALQEEELALAQQYTAQAQGLHTATNDQTERAAVLFAQAKLAHYFGNEQEALESARQSLAIYVAMGDRKAAAVIHLLLCRVTRALGDEASFQKYLEQGQTLALAVQDLQTAALFEGIVTHSTT